MNAREALIALNMLPKIGPVRVRRLMEHFGSAGDILRQSQARLMEVDGIGVDTAELICDWENRIDLAAELEEASQRGLSILTLEDEDYPNALRQSYDPPLALYVWAPSSLVIVMRWPLWARARHPTMVSRQRVSSHFNWRAVVSRLFPVWHVG